MKKPNPRLPLLYAALLAALVLATGPLAAQTEVASGHDGHAGHTMPQAADRPEPAVGGVDAEAAPEDAAADAPAMAASGSGGMSMGGGKGKCGMHGKKGGHGKGDDGHGGHGRGHGKMAGGGDHGGGHGKMGKGGGGHGGHGKEGDGGPPMYGEHWKESLTPVQKAELDRLHLELARVKAPMKAMAKALKVQLAVLATSPQAQPEAIESVITQLLDAEREILRAETRYTAAQRAVLNPEQQVSFDLHTIHGTMHGKGVKGGKGHGGGH
jgi:hypothetical protein